MPKTRSAPAPAKSNNEKRVKYTEPSVNELKALHENSKVKATHKATDQWVKALEEFRSDIGYKGKIEEVDSKTVLEDQLSKFVYAMKRQDGQEYRATSI
ncbi:9194_t:CDS:1, partial [Racocetra persica]